jgi:hypothetical protein
LLNRYPGIRPPRSHEGRIEYWDKWFGDKQLIDITKTDCKRKYSGELECTTYDSSNPFGKYGY